MRFFICLYKEALTEIKIIIAGRIQKYRPFRNRMNVPEHSFKSPACSSS